MGITKSSLDRLARHHLLQPGKMLELGAQNLYDKEHYGQVAKQYFEGLGIEHLSWDITPHQGAIAVDLREEVPVAQLYDVVTDFGTTEHVSGNYYMAHRNIHNHCKVGGYIVHENPKTGNWPGHGCNYVDMEFYTALARLCNYRVVELGEEYAMGNTIDGCNVVVVLRRLDGGAFISEEQFNSIGHVFAK